jgi:hypothetical protein
VLVLFQQCELLYMLEGSHPTTHKLSVGLLQLQADLRQVSNL